MQKQVESFGARIENGADVERLAAQVSVEPLPARSPGFF